MSGFFTLVTVVSLIVTVGTIVLAFVLAAKNGNASAHAGNKALSSFACCSRFLWAWLSCCRSSSLAFMSMGSGSNSWVIIGFGVTIVGLAGKWLIERFGRVLYGWFKGDPAYW
ncbi:MAG: hypothetical protein IPL62_11665 [Caulobacteraceae bacterium]|nr:hypothetical protein [Caulobacteraceae bacterium]